MADDLERLAQAEWPVNAVVQVVQVTVAGDRAEVALLVDDYEYWMYFKRELHGPWSETISGNAPTDGWDDPSRVEW
jgi:hypothetical protein